MSRFRPILMIRTAAAEQTPVHQTLLDILGQPTEPDPENLEEVIDIVPDNVADYFKHYRDFLAPVQSNMPIRVEGDKTVMFPGGYTEEYMFPVILADRIPGATAKEQQENREALKAVFGAMTEGSGASWTYRYLSTQPEAEAYLSLIQDGGEI